MSHRLRSRTAIALILSLIAAISAAQTPGLMSQYVSADNTLSLQLTRTTTSTESTSATGSVVVNLDSGQVKVELKGASPDSAYLIVFVGTAGTVQLGTLTTGSDGEGTMGANLNAGTYVGVFQVFRAGIPQFVTATTSINVGLATSATGSISSTGNTTTLTTQSTSQSSSTQTVSSETQTISGTLQVSVQIDPTARSVNAGEYAKFNIVIHANSSANIQLAARGVPPRSVAIFTQDVGVASPEFHSTLTIVTATETPVGNYAITVIALVNGQEYDTQAGLQVSTASTTATTGTTSSTTVGLSLAVSVTAEHNQYQPNATVNLQGHVSDNSGSVVADAGVSLQLDGPTGVELLSLTDLRTDTAGVFQASFKLPDSATAGTYTAFVSASKQGYTTATTHTTFVVGISSTPSPLIKEVYVTDTSGARSATFSPGQTVLVWVVVENSGASFEGVTWVQIRDPNGVPVWIQLQISTLGTGQTVKVAFGFTISSGMASGLYTANALVSDKLISQGGTFFASATTEFAITV